MKEKLNTEDEYRKTLSYYISILGAPEGSLEAAEIDQLMILLEEYEKENC